MEIKTPLEFGHYYHIYNRGNNGIDIFLENDNYSHFLRLYSKYIEPIAETYAWCLMKNHFHILVRIKDKYEIIPNELSYNTTEKPKVVEPYRQFSHLFNAYAQAINKRFHRTGSLFENKFERKQITSEKYLKQLIYYIHNNPVHHGFVAHMSLYPWSSYNSFLSEEPTQLKSEEVFDLYNGKENFIVFHNKEYITKENTDFIVDF